MSIQIVACTINDWAALLDLAYRTFDETFRSNNSEENMESYLKTAFTEEKIKEELNHPESEFHFIYLHDHLAGYLKVNTGDAQTENMGDESLEIERIYVKKAYQRHGLGMQLYNKALSIAKQNLCAKIWLGVWEHNPEAIAFYKQAGFHPVGTHSFYMGNEKQTDIIMEKII